MPNPGQMAEFVARGALIPVDGLVDLAQFPKAFVDLATVDGKVYGIFISADLKSLVWYNPDALYAEGLAPADSWNELLYITEALAARGRPRGRWASSPGQLPAGRARTGSRTSCSAPLALRSTTSG